MYCSVEETLPICRTCSRNDYYRLKASNKAKHKSSVKIIHATPNKSTGCCDKYKGEHDDTIGIQD